MKAHAGKNTEACTEASFNQSDEPADALATKDGGNLVPTQHRTLSTVPNATQSIDVYHFQCVATCGRRPGSVGTARSGAPLHGCYMAMARYRCIWLPCSMAT